jgi:hypothetical protein
MKKSLLYLLCLLLLTFTGCSSEEINDEEQEDEIVVDESPVPEFSDEYPVGFRDECPEAIEGADRLRAYVGEHIHLMGTIICNMFAYDVTGDGYRDLCASVFTGSGIVTSLVVVYDVQNGQGYMLNDRGDYDYWIESIEDDRLVATREEYGVYEYDTTVTGTIGFDDGVLYFVEDTGM